MSLNEPTLGEIARRLDELAQDVKDIPIRISQEFVRADLHRAETNHLNDRVKKLESRHEWIVRTVGGLIFAVIATWMNLK